MAHGPSLPRRLYAAAGSPRYTTVMLSRRTSMRLCFHLCTVLLLCSPLLAQNTSVPWSDAQTVQPADLNKELANPKTAPVVLFVGFERLYSAGHIKGAQYHGPAATAKASGKLNPGPPAFPAPLILSSIVAVARLTIAQTSARPLPLFMISVSPSSACSSSLPASKPTGPTKASPTIEAHSPEA